MTFITGKKTRATQSYEAKKEMWLVQVVSDPKLSRAAMRVAVGIAVHMNRKQNMLAWPGQRRLAEMLHMSRATVCRGVADLEVHQHIRVTRSKTGKKNDANHYHINIWALGGGPPAVLRGPPVVPRVDLTGMPEPPKEPLKEPLIRRSEEEIRIVGRGSKEAFNPLAQTPPSNPRQAALLGVFGRVKSKWEH
jgi:hypothetical protein